MTSRLSKHHLKQVLHCFLFFSLGHFLHPLIVHAQTGTFTDTGSMTPGRYYHTATLLSNGNVLVTGGTDGSTSTASAELYQTVSLAPPPMISLSPTSLNFVATPGGTNPASQSVTVSNSGDGALSWVTGTITTSGGA